MISPEVPSLPESTIRSFLSWTQRRYHKRAHTSRDPIHFLYSYPDPLDREIVGLIASSLAYGRVEQILPSVRHVLGGLGTSPRGSLMGGSASELRRRFARFRHRFTGSEELVALLCGIKRVLRRYGSLGACFAAFFTSDHKSTLPALARFSAELTGNRPTYLVPSPSGGSACKRLNLYLRWQVRSDAVDCGTWSFVPPRALIVPLDVHLFRLSRLLGFTTRRTPDLKSAGEVTEAFRRFCPADPLRFDFAVNRFAVEAHRKGLRLDECLQSFRRGEIGRTC